MSLLHLPNFSLAPSALAVAYPSSFGGMCVQNTSHASTVFVFHLIITNGWWFQEVIKNNVPIVRTKTTKCLCRNCNFIDLLSDFALLIYLSGELDDTDMKKICESVINRDIPLEPGYKIIISSMAGIDSAY